eukprot:TRINITY_DN3604_c0_g1_i1.p1 TRINITY_DN3604_c0_g1~~TRINITY_DN3604_c0_g1_i1.p1  ORF type:complete len:311 (-),score=50.60 TRINITY_DN3604_c0_g1_i1:24-956(-)
MNALLARKLFYLDTPDRAAEKLTPIIESLGGKVSYGFSGKSVTHVVTNRHVKGVTYLDPKTASVDSSMTGPAKEATATDILVLCGRFGIQVHYARTFVQWIKPEIPEVETRVPAQKRKAELDEDPVAKKRRLAISVPSTQSNITVRSKNRSQGSKRDSIEIVVDNLRKAKSPFVVVEDVNDLSSLESSKKYKPFFLTFSPPGAVIKPVEGNKKSEQKDPFPQFYFFKADISSPFTKTCSTKTQIVRKPSEQPLKLEAKCSGGWCEVCKVTYENYSEHVGTSKHKEFAQNPENFAEVDMLLASLGSLNCDH